MVGPVGGWTAARQDAPEPSASTPAAGDGAQAGAVPPSVPAPLNPPPGRAAARRAAASSVRGPGPGWATAATARKAVHQRPGVTAPVGSGRAGGMVGSLRLLVDSGGLGPMPQAAAPRPGAVAAVSGSPESRADLKTQLLQRRRAKMEEAEGLLRAAHARLAAAVQARQQRGAPEVDALRRLLEADAPAAVAVASTALKQLQNLANQPGVPPDVWPAVEAFRDEFRRCIDSLRTLL